MEIHGSSRKWSVQPIYQWWCFSISIWAYQTAQMVVFLCQTKWITDIHTLSMPVGFFAIIRKDPIGSSNKSPVGLSWWFKKRMTTEDLFVTGRKTESGGRIQAIQSGKLWFSLDQRGGKDPVLTVLPTMASEHDSPIWILHVVFLVYGYTISIHEWYVISWKNQTCEITHYHLLPSIAIYYHLLPLSHVEPFLVEQSPHTDLSLLLSFQHLQQQSHPFDVCDTDHAFLFMANLGSALHTVENLNLLYNYIIYIYILYWKTWDMLFLHLRLKKMHKFGGPFTQGPVHNF